MKRKTDEELARSHVAKTVRTLVRLKHSLAADEELNSVLPDRLEDFDKELVVDRNLKELQAGIDDVLGD